MTNANVRRTVPLALAALLALSVPASAASVYWAAETKCDNFRCIYQRVGVASHGCSGTTCFGSLEVGDIEGESTFPGATLTWSDNHGHSGSCALTTIGPDTHPFSCRIPFRGYLINVPVNTLVCETVTVTVTDAFGSFTHSLGVCGVIDP